MAQVIGCAVRVDRKDLPALQAARAARIRREQISHVPRQGIWHRIYIRAKSFLWWLGAIILLAVLLSINN